MRKDGKLHTKNIETGKHESINQRDIEVKDWGFSFFVDSEIDAFKAAYLHRYAPHGVRIEFAAGAQEWMVTVFNSKAKAMGID